MSQKIIKNILIARPDRIGDVILTTPALKVLRENYPNAKISFLVRKEIAPLIRLCPEVDDVVLYDPEKRHKGFAGMLALIQQIRKRKIDLAFLIQNTWEVSLAVYLAGVADRVGPLSKMDSYLFFNRGMRQKRSQVKMHEAEYNIQLLQHYGLKVPPVGSRAVEPQIVVANRSVKMAHVILAPLEWKSFIVVHPGMRGSAKNWPKENYIKLTQELIQNGKNVFLSFGPGESELMNEFEGKIQKSPQVYFYGGKQARSLSVLAAIYQKASCVVAPSTGPLHIAVALKVPVVSIYPTIKVQSKKRWGPFVKDPKKAVVFEGIDQTTVVDVFKKVCETEGNDGSK